MSDHKYPYATLFQKHIPGLGPPNEDGWASGSCPFCGERDTFKVNLQTGRWVCFPTPGQEPEPKRGKLTSRGRGLNPLSGGKADRVCVSSSEGRGVTPIAKVLPGI